MRSIFAIALIILVVGSLTCRWVGSAADPRVAAAAPWVRTAGGWERLDDWRTSVNVIPTLHPLVVASGQALASILALAACTVFPRSARP